MATTANPPGSTLGAGDPPGDAPEISQTIIFPEPPPKKYTAYAPISKFPGNEKSIKNRLQSECFKLDDAKPSITTVSPKMAVIETKNVDTWNTLTSVGIKVNDELTVIFKDYATDDVVPESDLTTIVVSGLPMGMSAKDVGLQLAAQIGKPWDELSAGCKKRPSYYRRKVFYTITKCPGVDQVVQRGHLFVLGTMLRVHKIGQMPNREGEQAATVGLYGLPAGTTDQRLYQELSRFKEFPKPKAVQVIRRGPTQKLIRVAAIIFESEEDCKMATMIKLGAGSWLKDATWAPLDPKACYACGDKSHLVLHCAKAAQQPRRVPPKAAPMIEPRNKPVDSRVKSGKSWASAVQGTLQTTQAPTPSSPSDSRRGLLQLLVEVGLLTPEQVQHATTQLKGAANEIHAEDQEMDDCVETETKWDRMQKQISQLQKEMRLMKVQHEERIMAIVADHDDKLRDVSDQVAELKRERDEAVMEAEALRAELERVQNMSEGESEIFDLSRPIMSSRSSAFGDGSGEIAADRLPQFPPDTNAKSSTGAKDSKKRNLAASNITMIRQGSTSLPKTARHGQSSDPINLTPTSRPRYGPTSGSGPVTRQSSRLSQAARQ